MDLSFTFFLNSFLLGLGLTADAFTVSLANGLNTPNIGKGKTCFVAGTFAFFQALMPMIGWVCVHTIVQYFSVVAVAVPYVSLALLAFIGGKMIYDGVKKKEEEKTAKLTVGAVLIQGVATSIDALSVGFTIAEYGWQNALVCAVIIAVVTFVACLIGVIIGKKFGTKFSSKASIIGGVILIAIGLEIFITGVFF